MSKELRSDICRLQRLNLRRSMDGMVHDLSQALEESSSSSYYKARRKAFKRRVKSAQLLGAVKCGALSEDSESSMNYMTMSQERSVDSRYQVKTKPKCVFGNSDSEDVSSSPEFTRMGMDMASSKGGSCFKRVPSSTYSANVALESDSLNDVNENFSPIRPHTRRKRRFKRMAVDVDCTGPSVSRGMPIPRTCMKQKKKRLLQQMSLADNRHSGVVVIGKRKRGIRDRGGPGDPETGGESSNGTSPQTGLLNLKYLSLSSNAADQQSRSVYSSSVSGSESDTGIITNDEGREADDEQSDWCHSPGRGRDFDLSDIHMWLDSDEESKLEQSLMDGKPPPRGLFSETFTHQSQQGRQGIANKLRRARIEMADRTLCVGRRRLRERRPGCQIVTSHNEEISRFLQDSRQHELRINPAIGERDQLQHIASLYSLSLQEITPSTVLTKTKNTTQAVMTMPPITPRFATPVSLAESKRLRKTPLSTSS